jgi:surfeit locus 1 family protein
MIRFRPALGPTIATAMMLPVLIGLGVWQLQRLSWKEALIAALDHNMRAAPVSLNAPHRIAKTAATQYLRVAVRGRFLNTKESYLFAGDTAGNAGYHVITPLETPDRRLFLVDRGYVPMGKLSPATRAAGQVAGEQRIVGLWRWPTGSGPFTPKPDLMRRIWYARDPETMAKADALKLEQPAIIDADATPNPGGWPKGGQTVIDIPNNHLSYALTWFGLALVLSGIYVSYHIAQGRLTAR